MGNVLRNDIHFQLGPCKKGISVPIWGEGGDFRCLPFSISGGCELSLRRVKAIDLFTDSDAIFEMSIWQCIMVYSGYMKSKQTRYRTT